MKRSVVVMLGVVTLNSVAAMAQGSSGAGNGGRGWVCYEPKDARTGKRAIKSVELVDYVEARSITKWNIDLGVDQPGVDDTQAMIETALARLSRVDQYRADRVRSILKEIKENSVTLDLERDKITLNKISDANVLIAPSESEDCVERQVAFNKVNPGPMGYKFAFVKQYLDKMSDRDRAGLMLHEAVYNYEASLGATNSDGSREFVRAISSPALASLSVENYRDFSKQFSQLPTVTTKDGGSYRDAYVVQNELSSGKLLTDQAYSAAVLCPEKTQGARCFISTKEKKYFPMKVQAKAGDRIFFEFDETYKNSGVFDGNAEAIGPVLSAPLKAVYYRNSGDSLLFTQSFVNHMFDSFGVRVKIAQDVAVAYPSLMPANRLKLDSNDNQTHYTIKFKNGKRVSIDLDKEILGYQAYATFDSEGYVTRLELAPEYYGKTNVTLTDVQGQRIPKLLINRLGFPNNANVRYYWVLDFDSEGNLVKESTERRRERD